MVIRHKFITVAVLAGVIIASTQVTNAQDLKVADADVSVWISDIWEHKVILSVSWSYPQECTTYIDRSTFGVQNLAAFDRRSEFI